MIDFSTFLAVDRVHLAELKYVWNSWCAFKPEIFNAPMIVAYDADQVSVSQMGFMREVHPSVTFYAWSRPACSQREKMLASFVFLAPMVVQTPWYLKLDTDVVATRSAELLNVMRWRSPQDSPVFVASPWGYTKPATAIQVLDDWGDTVPELKDKPRLNLPFDAHANKVKCPGRIISWCFFGQTQWCRQAALLCQGRWPVPSHDTFLWYVAARSGAPYLRIRMKDWGWSHQRIPI